MLFAIAVDVILSSTSAPWTMKFDTTPVVDVHFEAVGVEYNTDDLYGDAVFAVVAHEEAIRRSIYPRRSTSGYPAVSVPQ